MGSSSTIQAVAPEHRRYRTFEHPTFEPGEVRCFPTERPVRVVMRGDIDLTTLPQLDLAYRELTQLEPGDVVVDLSEVTLLGCVALRLLVALTARLSPTGHEVIIQAASPPARRLLDLAGLP
ncbi:STAS domain-containing protein [Nocardia acidivorans]|uniref:STAS domain-containing protein n=1 Tax=Nocardia acidivorans TaxID=404580 RepID=UPI00082BE085|nr:STAS domain-containing protein [Nocardia acidivorans]